MMLNKAHPFSASNKSILYNDQITRNWKLIGRYSVRLSSALKEALRMLLEPIPEKRWDIEQFLDSNWMKNSLLRMTEEEKNALDEARNQQI